MAAEKENAESSIFVAARTRLYVSDAAAAIIVVEDGRYLLQLRDEIETIWYPGHWGCFGGGVEQGEDALVALRRELREELALDFNDARFFTEIEFDLTGLGLERYYRKYYLISITLKEMHSLRLAEGEAVAAFDSDTMLGRLKVSPYDAFALFLHARASRLHL